MKGLDLSKFRKTGSDGACTTMKHPDGHMIKLSHKSLAPKFKEGLDKLPVHMDEGGEAQHGATGSWEDDKQQEQQQANPNPQPPPQGPVSININPTPQPTALPPPNQNPAPTPAAASAAPKEQFIAPSDNGNIQAPPPPQMKPAMAQVVPKPPENVPDSAVMQPPPSGEMGPPAPPVSEDMAQKQKDWEFDLKNQHITPKTYSNLFANTSTLGKIGLFFAALVGGAGAGLSHQPNALFDMMDRTIDNDLKAQMKSKENAQNFLRITQQHEMNDAQIAQLAKQGHLTDAQVKMMQKETEIKSFGLAKAYALQSGYQSLLDKINKMPPGPERQKYENAAGLVYQKMGDQLVNINAQVEGAINMNKALFGDQGAGGENPEQQFQQQQRGRMMLGPEGQGAAKYLEEHRIPGVKGSSSTSVDKADREKMRNMKEFDDTVQRVREWAKKHSGLFNQLNVADRNYGITQLTNLQSLYREGQGMGQLKGFDIPLLEKEIGTNPMHVFNSITNDPKLKAAQDANQSKMRQMTKSLGLPDQGAKSAASARSAAPKSSGLKEGQTGKSASGKSIVVKDGKWNYAE